MEAPEQPHNPFALADKTLVKGGERRRRRIISAAKEVALLVALRACRNIEMPLIFAVALSTGMRRAEVLGLLWSQIDLALAPQNMITNASA